jgi:RHS repeat-associated protein
LGQVTSGKRSWSDAVPVAGQQFEYAYDDIGNRKSAAEGGNAWGTGLRYGHYTVNNLNQYTQRTVPPCVDVLGSANSNATVTVNDTNTYRKAEYFRGELTVTNAVGPIWISLTNLAVLQNGTNSDIATNFVGGEFVPKTPEAFTYDLDGNLSSDGRWTNRWDGENRLISIDSHSGAPDGSRLKLVLGYDSQGRRTSKIVSNWIAGAWLLAGNIRFVYDGWNLIAELNATNNAVINSYLWGLDLSSSPQGAGGIGGLLAVKSTENGTHFTAFDGNGNVGALASVTNGSQTAQFEYEPFSQMLRTTGPLALVNPFRFSTKYQDNETDLIYYGYRYANPNAGKWLSRDPIEERGGYLLYAFVGNNPISRIDKLGLTTGQLELQCCRRKQAGDPPPPPSATKGYSPKRNYPGVSTGCALTCCDDQTIEKGRMTLRDHYFQAVQAAKAIGLTPVDPGEKGATCKLSSIDFINWLAPYPPCWYCYLEERDRSPNDVNELDKDHQVIICNAYGYLGEIRKQIMFDWWGQTKWLKPYGDENPDWAIKNSYYAPLQYKSPDHFSDCQGRIYGTPSPKNFDGSTKWKRE